MAESIQKPREYLKRKTAVKEIFYYENAEKHFNIKCKEVFLKEDKIVQYPFLKDKGEPKYGKVQKIEFKGFNGKLPRGIFKEASTGYGFTKIYSPIIYFIEDIFDINTIIVDKKGENKIDLDKAIITFNHFALDKIYPVLQNTFDTQRKEIKKQTSELLNGIFPKEIKVTQDWYVKNTIYSSVKSWGAFYQDFSKEDIESLFELVEKINNDNTRLNTTLILKTRESIEERYIEDTIKLFQDNLKQKTETSQLEEKWQVFLKENTWIFSQLLSYPVILHQDKAYVGGKDIGNKGGKINDFLIQNDLTKNVAFVEIKTHRSKLLKHGSAYRGNDVFAISDDLTGAINQVLDQRDNFQKEYYVFKGKSSTPIETLNSKCIVIIGLVNTLKPEEMKSFELFRSNSKDVIIVTFDELLERLKLIQSLMVN